MTTEGLNGAHEASPKDVPVMIDKVKADQIKSDFREGNFSSFGIQVLTDDKNHGTSAEADVIYSLPGYHCPRAMCSQENPGGFDILLYLTKEAEAGDILLRQYHIVGVTLLPDWLKLLDPGQRVGYVTIICPKCGQLVSCLVSADALIAMIYHGILIDYQVCEAKMAA